MSAELPAAAPTAEAPHSIHPHAHGLLPSLQSMLSILVIALFILTFSVQPFRIPSESMEPTLLVGDFSTGGEAGRRGELAAHLCTAGRGASRRPDRLPLPGGLLHASGQARDRPARRPHPPARWPRVHRRPTTCPSLMPSSSPRRRTAIATSFHAWIALIPAWMRAGGSRCASWS